MAKQTAGQRNFQVALTDQFRYDLAPDFFLIGMLKSSSARVIIKAVIYHPTLSRVGITYVYN